MTRYRITVSSHNRDQMLDLMRKHKIQIFDHGIRRSDKEGYIVDALIEDQNIAVLKAKGYKIERYEDVDQEGKARQHEVGQGNRYIKP
jgi:hypothetical protein